MAEREVVSIGPQIEADVKVITHQKGSYGAGVCIGILEDGQWWDQHAYDGRRWSDRARGVLRHRDSVYVGGGGNGFDAWFFLCANVAEEER